MSKKRFAMANDTRKCVGCNACVIACKTENSVPLHRFRDWVEQELVGTFPDLSMEIRSMRCNHCTNAPCVTVCPTGASWIHEDGVVLVNHNKCTGCKACMAACPYDARFLHPRGYVEKCTFCAHRSLTHTKTSLGATACVTVCPTGSLIFGDTNDPDSDISKALKARKHKVNHPETGCDPNHYFLL